ncbi:hypothetical protein [Melghirimyces algeriensis]|nr:hypothetical protein [Melghirimyces algeriensis]
MRNSKWLLVVVVAAALLSSLTAFDQSSETVMAGERQNAAEPGGS